MQRQRTINLKGKELSEKEIERQYIKELAKRANNGVYGLIELEEWLVNKVTSLFHKHSIIKNAKINLSSEIRLASLNDLDFSLYSYYMVRNSGFTQEDDLNSIPARFREELLSIFLQLNIKESDFFSFKKDLVEFNNLYSYLLLYLISKNDIVYSFERERDQLLVKESNYIFLG